MDAGDQACMFCEEPGPARCPRCGTPVCAFHGPYREGLACRRCEEEWDRGHQRRVLLLVPIGAAVLAVTIAVAGAAFVLISEHAPVGSFAPIVALFVGPIVATIAVMRLVTRVTFRRRFFSNAPPRIPPARVSRRR